MEVIKLENINYKYDEIIALKDINLVVNRSECLLLMGDNGCGKSTLLKLINGLIKPLSGKYYFNNELVDEKYLKDNIRIKNLHQRIGYVFQDANSQLFCRNVYEELSFGPLQMNLDEKEVYKRVEDILDYMDIRHLKDRSIYELSGGEKRKVAIGSILTMNPDILVLDEPVASLDNKSKKWLIEFLKDLKTTGKTMIIASHDNELAKELADRIVCISDEHQIL